MDQEKKHIKFLAYGTYSRILNGGRHHGAIQTGYRIIASSWLLATFAGIGFLLSSDNILPFNHLLGVSVLCMIGITGLYLTWYEDTFVQEMLLDINVVEGLRLEKQFSWLPQVHHCFLRLYQTTNARFVKVLFFIGCKSILFFIMWSSLAIYFYKFSYILSLTLVLLFFFTNYISSKIMIYKAGEIQEFMEFLNDVDERRTRS